MKGSSLYQRVEALEKSLKNDDIEIDSRIIELIVSKITLSGYLEDYKKVLDKELEMYKGQLNAMYQLKLKEIQESK